MTNTKYKYYCCYTCGGYISHEHGGILCKNCNRLYCCNDKCISGVKDISRSQTIKFCHNCLQEIR